MKQATFSFLILLLLISCHKAKDFDSEKQATTPITTAATINYTIKQGQHYCEQNYFKPVDLEELKFSVVFDSSAVYTSVDPVNQYDINKLYGFSDNDGEHHQFSARFGWRWSDNALRLFAYIYNNGIVSSKELGVVSIGQEITCSIKASASDYIFTLNDRVLTMPRLSTTPKAKGYMLYPYFGGDETAPHDIHIRIQSL